MSPREVLDIALEGVLRRFESALEGLSRRMRLDDDERDALRQEVRIRLWKAAREGENPDAVGPSFLYRAARWAALDLLRQRRGVPGAGEGVALDHPAVPAARQGADALLEERERREAMAQGLATLAPDRRVVVGLWLAGHERAEIEAMLGWSEARVRNLLYRGIADLRDRLGPQLDRGLPRGARAVKAPSPDAEMSE